MRIVEASKKTKDEFKDALKVLKVNYGTLKSIVSRHRIKRFAEPMKQ